MDSLRLRDLGFGTRLGLTGVLCTLVLGLFASLEYLRTHHAPKDGDAESVSIEDLTGAYHGVSVRAPLVVALEDGHPEDLPAAERELLLDWLGGDRVSTDYDSLELGDQAPAEILAARCGACHARNATGEMAEIGQRLPLDYWDDVERVAFGRELAAMPEEILVVTTHTHAVALGLLTLAAVLLHGATRWPRALKGLAAGAAGVSLFVDLASWWLARESAAFVYVIVAAGGTWAFFTLTMLLATVVDLWLPRRKEVS